MALPAPHKRGLNPVLLQNIAKHFGFAPLSVLMAQAVAIVGFGVDFGIEPFDQQVTMQPCDQRDRVGHLSEPKCQMIAAAHL